MRDTELVSFFVCGVQKGGTTSLFAHLCEHELLSPPSRKEPHFFDDETLSWPLSDYVGLHSFYSKNDGKKIRFDATPIYSFWTPSLARIRNYNPAAKLIFLFRDPIERAWSHWGMEYSKGKESLAFGDAIRSGRDRLKGIEDLSVQHRVFSYVERGFYSQQVDNALKLFAADQLLFLRSQDLRERHRETLASIASFLEIPSFPDTGPKREHASARRFEIDVTTEDLVYLASTFRDDFEDFSKLTALDLSDWITVKTLQKIRR